jgi:hypothetical protein
MSDRNTAQFTGSSESVRPPLDAMASAPDHHTILLENEHVRVLDTRLAAGQHARARTRLAGRAARA